MLEQVKTLEQEALSAISSVGDFAGLENLRIKYLGKNGLISELAKNIATLSPEEKPKFGAAWNEAKNKVNNLLREKQQEFSAKQVEANLNKEFIDITLPSGGCKRGKLHPITQIMEELIEVFKKLGFSIAEGPDVESDYYNFEALNIPKHHPSRDMWATFWINDEKLLRTHTSPVQIRVMEKRKPPLAVIMPGRVYRRDSDITHSPVFHQLEGLLVDKNINFGHLKGALTAFLHGVFGANKKVRFRPSYFPFTEPSAEVDVECVICEGKGCRMCKNTGWLEILGSGMVHPNVLRNVKLDPDKYSGFAFGLGVERIAMLKYGIDDIRLFYENDLRFLRQF